MSKRTEITLGTDLSTLGLKDRFALWASSIVVALAFVSVALVILGWSGF